MPLGAPHHHTLGIAEVRPQDVQYSVSQPGELPNTSFGHPLTHLPSKSITLSAPNDLHPLKNALPCHAPPSKTHGRGSISEALGIHGVHCQQLEPPMLSNGEGMHLLHSLPTCFPSSTTPHQALAVVDITWGAGRSGPDPPNPPLVTKKGTIFGHKKKRPETGRFGKPSAHTCTLGGEGDATTHMTADSVHIPRATINLQCKHTQSQICMQAQETFYWRHLIWSQYFWALHFPTMEVFFFLTSHKNHPEAVVASFRLHTIPHFGSRPHWALASPNVWGSPHLQPLLPARLCIHY